MDTQQVDHELVECGAECGCSPMNGTQLCVIQFSASVAMISESIGSVG